MSLLSASTLKTPNITKFKDLSIYLSFFVTLIVAKRNYCYPDYKNIFKAASFYVG